MQQILAFTRKELRLWAQKPGSWIIVFVVPLIFIAIVQSVFGSSGTPTVTLYAVNEDKSPQASQVMEALRNSANLKIEELQTREDADHAVGAGQRMAAVIIPEGFGQALTTPDGATIQIIVDPARSVQANIVIGLVNQAIAPITVDAEVSRGVEDSIHQVMNSLALATSTPPAQDQQGSPGNATPEPDLLQKFFTAGIKGVVSSQVEDALANPQVTIDEQPAAAEENSVTRQPSLLDSLVPGYSLMFLFFLVANIGVTVVEERETGTLRRLLIAPVPRSRILLGKMIPYFLIAVVQLATVLLASKFIYGIDLGNSVLALAMIILASALSMVTLGILVAAFARSEGQASGLAIVLVLIMAVISGAMFPGISISGLKEIAPHYWALQGFLSVIAQGQGVEGVLRPAGILLTMSAIFFTVGAIRFRFE